MLRGYTTLKRSPEDVFRLGRRTGAVVEPYPAHLDGTSVSSRYEAPQGGGTYWVAVDLEPEPHLRSKRVTPSQLDGEPFLRKRLHRST